MCSISSQSTKLRAHLETGRLQVQENPLQGSANTSARATGWGVPGHLTPLEGQWQGCRLNLHMAQLEAAVTVAMAGVQAQPSHGSAGGCSERVQGRNPQYTLLTSNLRACGGHIVAQRLGAQPCCCCCVASVMSNSVRPHRLPRPWDSPGKNTGVGCHFLLQCVLVKLLSRVQLLTTP